MTIYNVNIGIGWASSGVEYAQAYRATIFRKLNLDAKFIFTDMFPRENLSNLTRNIGFLDSEIIWLYSYFTDQKLGGPSTYTLEQLKSTLTQPVLSEEAAADLVTLTLDNKQVIKAYLAKGSKEVVKFVEYLFNGNLSRRDFFIQKKLFTEYYMLSDKKVQLCQRVFYNKDGSFAYEEIIDDKNRIYRFPNHIFYSKEELQEYFIESLRLQEDDVIILDRSTGIGQAVFRNHGKAKLGVVIHAEHYNQKATTQETILWNNFYDYQFTNSDHVDFFVTSTERQRDVLSEQFRKYTKRNPKIVAIPVGSLDELQLADETARKPFSVITASRLAGEKHIDLLVKAVIQAKKQLPQLQFDIYGSGGEEAKLRNIISNQGAKDYIHLCGHQNLTHIYQNYEAYLSGSMSEGFGLTLLEAIGSGLPIIGFDVPYGNQTFIKDGKNGYLVELADKENEALLVSLLAEKIVQLFTSKRLADARRESYEIAKSFLTAELEGKWKQLIEELVPYDKSI